MTVFTFSLTEAAFSQKNNLNYPKLNGNPFTINNLVGSPFVNTSLKSSLGFATSLQTKIPLQLLNDSTTLKIDADISYISGDFQYQYAIQDWALIWLNFSGLGRLGTNTASLFVSGVTANTNFETGMLFKIAEFKESIFSTSVRIVNSNSTILNIFSFFTAVIDSNYSQAGLVNNLNPLSGEIDLRTAFSPSPPWSLMSYIKGSYGENVDKLEIKDKFTYQLGASANYNLNIKDNIPIGIGAGIKLDSQSPTLEFTKRLTQFYMIQLAYTGRQDFILSLESLYTRIPVNFKDITINLSSFSFSWAYFF